MGRNGRTEWTRDGMDTHRAANLFPAGGSGRIPDSFSAKWFASPSKAWARRIDLPPGECWCSVRATHRRRWPRQSLLQEWGAGRGLRCVSCPQMNGVVVAQRFRGRRGGEARDFAPLRHLRHSPVTSHCQQVACVNNAKTPGHSLVASHVSRLRHKFVASRRLKHIQGLIRLPARAVPFFHVGSDSFADEWASVI